MKAIIVTEQAAGTAGMQLTERRRDRQAICGPDPSRRHARDHCRTGPGAPR